MLATFFIRSEVNELTCSLTVTHCSRVTLRSLTVSTCGQFFPKENDKRGCDLTEHLTGSEDVDFRLQFQIRKTGSSKSYCYIELSEGKVISFEGHFCLRGELFLNQNTRF